MTLVSKAIVWVVLSSLAAFGAKADDLRSLDVNAQDVQAAKLVICGTAEKAQHFAAKDHDIQAVIASNNEASSASSPCLIAGIAYVSGQQVDRVRNKDVSYAVTEILIVGVETPFGFMAVKPEVVYTLFKVEDEKA
jgi:hypothetical protein